MDEELVLRFGPREPGGSYPVFVAGARAGTFHPPFGAEFALGVEEWQQEALEGLGRTADPAERNRLLEVLAELARGLTAAGKALYSALFDANPDLAVRLRAAPPEARLALEFDRGARGLLPLPWEYLTAPDGRRLAAR